MSQPLPPVSDSATLAEAIAQRCEDAHVYKEGWRARCPSHQGESDTSLSITASHDRVMVHCFGGCTTDAVVSAMGLTLADLFLDTPAQGATHAKRHAKTHGHRRIVKVYDYYDVQGTLVHQTVRYDPKQFAQRRPDPHHPGQSIWNLDGVDLVLYNLPQVLAAKQAGATIHLAEGEKDADTLTALGFVATTVPMGAKYWRARYTEILTEVDVVVWPDNDKAGQAGRLKVEQALTGKAQPLRIASVPTPYKDVSDWVQAGATRPDIDARVQHTTPSSEPPPFIRIIRLIRKRHAKTHPQQQSQQTGLIR